MNQVEKMIKRLMIDHEIKSLKQLAYLAGMKERTLSKHIANPSMFRVGELTSLDEVLNFGDDDWLVLRGRKE